MQKAAAATDWRIDRAIDNVAAGLMPYLHRRGVVPFLVILLWACAVLPNLTVRSFIWEEGTNAEIARDVLAHGHFFEPYIYGLRWHDKPSLLSWLIAGFAALTGGVNEWSSRLPAMLSILITALLVEKITRHYASPAASLFAALSFLFCPLLLQKLTIAEPDSVLTLLSFAALLLWWAGVAAGRLTILHWLGCGCLLGILAMAKGPQPAGFFACGVLAHLLIERRWRDLPGYCLCMAMPVAATLAWGAIVYRAGDEATWLAYSRLRVDTGLFEYVAHNTGSIGRLALELLPATFMLPFVPWPWSRPAHGVVVPRIVAPMLLYSCACTAILFLWPGYNPRYAMPIAPSVAVLAGMGWDQLEKSGRSAIRRVVAAVLGLLIAFQIVLVAIVMPVFSDRFGETRSDGIRIGQAIRAAPAPAFCTGWDTNQLFYAGVQLQCLDPAGLASLPSPAWLIVPRDQLPEIARLRPDLDLRIALETNSGPKLTAVQVVEKAK